mgnify:CR=1 FL=1
MAETAPGALVLTLSAASGLPVTVAYTVGGTATAPTVGIEAYFDPTRRETLIGQANLEWHVSTGPIRHVILLGGEYTSQDSHNERINGFFSATAPAAANRCAVCWISFRVL